VGATSFQGCSPDGQMSFLGMLEDRAPEQDAVAEANIYEVGIIPDPVIKLMRDMRRRRGERQEDVARKLGISRPQLANAERQRSGLGRGPATRLKRWIAAGVAAA
jgi:DNA-binding XRE family transcriptional regulator